MKVKELIKKLKKYKQNREVIIGIQHELYGHRYIDTFISRDTDEDIDVNKGDVIIIGL